MNPHQSGNGQVPYSTQAAPGAQQNQATRRTPQLAVALLLVAAWGFPGTSRSEAPIRVTVEPLAALAMTLRESAPASVISLNRSHVPAQIAAVIESIEVMAGQVVTRGETLATLDCTEPNQNLERSEAQLDALQARRRLADQQLQRAIRLLPTRNISEEQANQRRAEFEAVEAEIAAQRVQIAIGRHRASRCIISSPFDGVVIDRLVSLGEYVSPGTPVVDVLDTSELEVSARIPLESAGDLATQSPVFSALGREYPLTLRSLLPLVHEGSRSREARLSFTSVRALAGTPGQLVWTTSDRAVPAYLLASHQDRKGIFIAEHGVARFLELPGALDGRAAVTDLDPTSLIVTDGRHLLKPGDAIDTTP